MSDMLSDFSDMDDYDFNSYSLYLEDYPFYLDLTIKMIEDPSFEDDLDLYKVEYENIDVRAEYPKC